MTPMGISRRTAIAAAGAALLPISAGAAEPKVVAWADTSAFPKGPLARTVGRQFQPPETATTWPDPAPLLGPDGPTTLAHWRGKTLLVALWAEWCAPCLAEMPSLSRLNRAYRSKTFEILPIATGTHAFNSWTDAQDRLRRMKDVDLPTLLDASPRRNALMNRLSSVVSPAELHLPPGVTIVTASLPCLLVVDPRGGLRGRFQGGPAPDGKNGPMDTLEGEALVKRLAEGALAA